MKVKFICRESKKTKDGLVPIEVSVTNMGVRKIISTGRKIKPNQFSPKTETVKGNNELNEYISAIRSRLYSINTNQTMKKNLENVSLPCLRLHGQRNLKCVSRGGNTALFLCRKSIRGIITYYVQDHCT